MSEQTSTEIPYETMHYAQRAALEVGDRVVTRFGHGTSYRFETVTRRTDTQIILSDGHRYLVRTGRQYGRTGFRILLGRARPEFDTGQASGLTADQQDQLTREALYHQNVHCNDPEFPYAYAMTCEKCGELAREDQELQAAETAEPEADPAEDAVAAEPEVADPATDAAAAEAEKWGLRVGMPVAWTTRRGERSTGTITAFSARQAPEKLVAVLELPGNPLGARIPVEQLRTMYDDAVARAEAANYRAHHTRDLEVQAESWREFAAAMAQCAQASAYEDGRFAALAVRLAATAAQAGAAAAEQVKARAQAGANDAARFAHRATFDGLPEGTVTAADTAADLARAGFDRIAVAAELAAESATGARFHVRRRAGELERAADQE